MKGTLVQTRSFMPDSTIKGQISSKQRYEFKTWNVDTNLKLEKDFYEQLEDLKKHGYDILSSYYQPRSRFRQWEYVKTFIPVYTISLNVAQLPVQAITGETFTDMTRKGVQEYILNHVFEEIRSAYIDRLYACDEGFTAQEGIVSRTVDHVTLGMDEELIFMGSSEEVDVEAMGNSFWQTSIGYKVEGTSLVSYPDALQQAIDTYSVDEESVKENLMRQLLEVLEEKTSLSSNVWEHCITIEDSATRYEQEQRSLYYYYYTGTYRAKKRSTR